MPKKRKAHGGAPVPDRPPQLRQGQGNSSNIQRPRGPATQPNQRKPSRSGTNDSRNHTHVGVGGVSIAQNAAPGRSAKRRRAEECAVSTVGAIFAVEATSRTHIGNAEEGGEVEDEEYVELQVGEIPPYPVKRAPAYHLGGMGRFGYDIPMPEFVPPGLTPGDAQSNSTPELKTSLSHSKIAVTTDKRELPVSRDPFQEDDFIRLENDEEQNDNEDGGNGCGESEAEVDVNADNEQDAISGSKSHAFTRAPSPPKQPQFDPARDYVFPRGIRKGRRFDSVLNDVAFLKTVGGDSNILDSKNWKGLRAAFEYHCPQYIKINSRVTTQASNSTLDLQPPPHAFAPDYQSGSSGSAINNTAPGIQTRTRNSKKKSPKNYVFDFGIHKGTRFDQAPVQYLKVIEAQVRAGQMNERVKLREAFEYHWWGGIGGGRAG